MFNNHSFRMDQKPSCIFPTTKLKNISCVFCRHQFYIRDLANLKGTHLPLLLSCGHAVCQNCTTNHAGDPCLLCKIPVEATGSSGEENLLPINVYVIGLIGVARTRPVHGDEPDISFSQAMTVRMKQRSIDQGCCLKCGMQAVLRCLQCDALLCHKCFSKIHNKLISQGQNEGHFRVMLTSYSTDPMFESKTCNEHEGKLEYYCEECKISGCAHCMLQYHPQHKVLSQGLKNIEYMDDFQRVHDKLAETMQRIRQAQKKLQKALTFPDELQNSETIEAAINQHFAHLHGVIQNVERRMIDKLYEQRSYMTRNLNDIQHRLTIQEDQVQSGLLMAASINDIRDRVNLKDVIAKLESLADVPCHLVQDPISDDEKIMFSPDSSIIEILENHCKIDVPEVTGFSLLTKDTLPMDYEIEPVVMDEASWAWDKSFSKTSLMRTSSCQSLSSVRSDTPMLKQKGYNSVHVCYIESPSNFYVRLAAHQKQAIDLENTIADYVKNQLHVPLIVQQNKIYAVKRYGGKWYRGRVNAINTNHGSPDTYEVFNLDFGRTENRVPNSRIRSIPSQIAAAPLTLIHCALNDIVPKDGKWRSDIRNSMKEFIRPETGRAVAMYIVNVKENTYYVDICKEPSNDAQGSLASIRDVLIFAGHGTFVSSQQLRRTSPQSVNRFFSEHFALDTYYDVKCSYVESPDCIHVQKAGDHLRHLAKMMTNMSKVCNEMIRCKNGIIYVPEIGMVCAVENSKGAWCRGLIYDVRAPQMVEVTLVDFGAKITTSYEKIRKLPDCFMSSAGQAIKVSLADVQPRNSHQWSESAIEFTKEYLGEKIVRIIAFEKSEFSYNVALYINDDSNFAAILASSSFGVSTGPRSSGVTQVPTKVTDLENQNQTKVRNVRTLNMKKKCNKNINGYSIQSAVESTETVDPFRLRVKVIRAESPNTIYVADQNNEKAYETMMAQMQKFYNQYKEMSNKCEWKVDFPCAVYSTRDRLFCRGKITAIDSPDEARVFLYDLAFTETVPIADLQALKKKFWHTQTYAFKVKLGGISPCGGSSEWPLSSCGKLKDLILENQKSKFYISKVDNPGENDLCVDLWVEQTKIAGPLAPAIIEVNLINKMLVDSGLALPIKRYNEKKRVLAIELKRQISYTDQEQRDEGFKFIENDQFTADFDEQSILSESNSSSVTLALSECTLVSNVEAPTSWLPAETIIDDEFVAEITYVDNDCCLYLHSIAQSANIMRSIGETLMAECATSETKPKDIVWAKGDLCIAQYHLDEKWYRAQVREVLKENMIQVEFIDYGNIELCTIEMIRECFAMTDIPRQCTKCVIHGIYPDTPNHTWTRDDLDLIHSRLVDKKCEITVIKRMDDHLVVSAVLLNPARRNLIPFFVKELRLDILVDVIEKESSDDGTQSTFDDNDDIIIDGYVEAEESEQDDENVNGKDIENEKDDDVCEKCIERNEDDDTKAKDIDRDENVEVNGKNIEENGNDEVKAKHIEGDQDDEVNPQDIQEDKTYEVNAIDIEVGEIDKVNAKDIEESEDDVIDVKDIKEGKDYEIDVKDIEEGEDYKTDVKDENENQKDYKSDYGNSEESDLMKVSTAVSVELSRTFISDDNSSILSTEDFENWIIPCCEDIVLSGTANFTYDADQIEFSQQEAMCKLESMSLPDTNSLKEDELVTSTPYNESFDSSTHDKYKKLVFPDELKVLKALVAVFGRTQTWLHLLDNKNSQIVTQVRNSYEDIVADMQEHAEDQPILTNVKRDTVCCVKAEDGLWYRCVVVDCGSYSFGITGLVRVRYVDWGNTADVTYDDIRAMKDEWLEAPCMSLPCKLWGIVEAPDAESGQFCEHLWEAYGRGIVSAVYVVLKGHQKEIYKAEIYIDDTCTTLVYEYLIRTGLFIKIDDEN